MIIGMRVWRSFYEIKNFISYQIHFKCFSPVAMILPVFVPKHPMGEICRSLSMSSSGAPLSLRPPPNPRESFCGSTFSTRGLMQYEISTSISHDGALMVLVEVSSNRVQIAYRWYIIVRR